MSTPPTKEEIKEIASHLRKPEGTKGIEIANMMNDGNQPMNLHTLAVVNPQANDAILEIGMANGYFVKNILALDPSITYYGLDYSTTMVNEAHKLNIKYVKNNQANFTEGTIENLPYKDKKFNKIVTINTFYFWTNPSKALNEIKRVLTTNGSFILSIRPKHNLEQFPVTQHNFTILPTENIITLLKEHGFNTIEKTEIKEPEQERWGKNFQRESLILKCSL